MKKKIRKRYHSEEAVKKALKIESFRNLTKDCSLRHPAVAILF